jgi:hypothetical protein
MPVLFHNETAIDIVTRPAWEQETNTWLRWATFPGELTKRLAGPPRKERTMSAERQVMQDYLDALVKRADFTQYYFPMNLLIEQLTR